MAACDECGNSADIPHSCSYCGGRYCDDHRVPERHKCAEKEISQSFAETADTGGEGVEAPDPINVAEQKRASGTGETNEASPDLNRDGSLDRSTELEWKERSEESRSFRLSITALRTRVRSLLVTPFQLASIALVLIGAWNLLGPIYGAPTVFAGVYRQFGIIYSDGLLFPVHLGDILVIVIGAAATWLVTR